MQHFHFVYGHPRMDQNDAYRVGDLLWHRGGELSKPPARYKRWNASPNPQRRHGQMLLSPALNPKP